MEILLPNQLLNRLDNEAKSRNANRSETLRRILQNYFEPQPSVPPPSSSESENINIILTRLDEINDKLNRINARVKTSVKSGKK